MTESGMIVNGVRFQANGVLLLDVDALRLSRRGVTGLVGKNGSGKSTFLRILAKQQTPSEGTVCFNGRPLTSWQERTFARHVAYLPQQTPLAAGLRARELIALGRYPWHGPLGRFTSEDARHVEEAIALTGIEDLSDRMVDSLSGGERQRVWLAMLIAQNAKLLLLDEPISALDPAHQVGVLSLIHRISVEKELTVLIVLHDVNLAARFCDRLIALKGGRVIAEGTPGEFMTAERLTRIYDVKMGVFPNPDLEGSIAYVRA